MLWYRRTGGLHREDPGGLHRVLEPAVLLPFLTLADSTVCSSQPQAAGYLFGFLVRGVAGSCTTRRVQRIEAYCPGS